MVRHESMTRSSPRTRTCTQRDDGRTASIERVVVTVVFAALLCPLAAALARALGSGVGAAFGLGAAAFLGLLPLLWRWLPIRPGGTMRRPLRCASWALLGLLAVVLHTRVAIYIVEPEGGHAGIVRDGFYTPHSCLSAYYTAAVVSRGPAPNLYEPKHYEKPKQGSPLGAFDQDDYFYPPPFLLLPRALLAISDDFVRVRAGWFFLESLAVLAALWFAARRSGAAPVAALLGVPLVFASVPMQATLQAGNFQAMALALSVLALVAVRDRRDALGGALLAFATLSKIFPGILLIYLLARRRWAAVAWTAAFAGVYTALALWVLGPRPFVAFLEYMLPRLSSGEAFAMLEQPAAIALNHSIAGMVLKLRLLGAATVSVAHASSAAWVYTLALVPVAFLLGRRLVRDSGGRELLLGFALLHLGALRSPFTPDPYAAIAPLWLAVLLLASELSGRRRPGVLIALGAAYLALQVVLPGFLFLSWPSGRLLAVAALPQCVEWIIVLTTIRVSLWARRRAEPVNLETEDPGRAPTAPALARLAQSGEQALPAP
jgi:hypothetical protein